MTNRGATGGKPKLRAVTNTATDIERLLDRVDQMLMAGDPSGVPAVMEQLWAVRRELPEIMTRRIIAGRVHVPAFAFDILGGFAGAKTPTYLRRIAAEPGVADIVRWGARRRAGWPERGEKKKRLTFLDTLQDPDGTLIVAIAQAGSQWPPDSEVLEEVLGYVAALPTARRRAVVERAIAETAEAADWLLHALLHSDDSTIQRLALAALVRARRPGAAGPVQRLAMTARDAEVRAEAHVAAQRLQLQVVHAGAPEEPPSLPIFQRAMATMIDGSGGQAVLVIRRWTEGLYLIADFLYNDTWGVKATFGAFHAQDDKLENIISGFGETGLDLVEMDAAAVRGLLAEAISTNAATGRPVPPAFEVWEPYVHETYPPAPDEPATPPELDDTDYAGRRELVKASGRLADHAFFLSWGFDASEMKEAMDVTPPPSGGRLTDSAVSSHDRHPADR
ncbi:MAG: HEAT repeat domain-containing protein [Dehalococcoidia bacterium]